MRRIQRSVLLSAALAPLVLGCVGCQTTAEKSARLAKSAKHVVLDQRGLTVTRLNPDVKVLSALVLHDQNGSAAVVTLRNDSSRPLRDVPIAITLKDTRGAVLAQNNTAGLDASLVSASLLAPHRELTWIDDQIQAGSSPATLSARVGEANAAPGALPRLDVSGVQLFDDPANGVGARGTLTNRSTVAQERLVIYAVGRRAGKIVAAGRAVLPSVPAKTSVPFQVFFIGSPRGAALALSAPPTTL
ncbi:MAG TPA: hypothetical protein VLJ42_07745 [Solirubrobacteraceae bacterium]|nr:hypothetical protein [Solirubrobacteraceae bacterium]